MTIRPAERSDLGGITRLYERVMRSGEEPSPTLREWFERVLFDHPWADQEVPSLVAVDDDGVVEGFLASHVRRLRIDGEAARLACSGQLVSDPAARQRAIGARLLRTYLDGPQDLTITDGATQTVRAMWERMGGELAHPHSIEWWCPLRPGSLAVAVRALRRGGPPSRAAGAAGRAGDVAARLLPQRLFTRLAGVGTEEAGARKTAVAVEQLTPESACAELPALISRLRLHPDYDAPFFGWLLAELATARDEKLRARLVRDESGRSLGWFVYYLAEGGIAPVISIAAPNEAASAAVLDALIDDARSGGAAAVRGRLEPRLVAPAAARGCLFRYAGQALVHSRNAQVAVLATSRHALLTRLEGEWWMAPHL